MRTILPSLLLLVAVLVAGFAAFSAYSAKGPGAVETWLVVAASLSVLVAAISAWAGHQIVIMQDEERQPNVVAALIPFDMAGGKTLRVSNTGSMSAIDVVIEWDIPSPDNDTEGFKQSIGQLQLYQEGEWRLPDTFNRSTEGYSATIQWQNRRGRKFRNKFKVMESDLEAISLAEAQAKHSATDPGISALRRDIAGIRKDLAQQSSAAARQISDALRGVRR